MTFTEKPRKCDRSNKEIWWGFLVSYQYDEDYRHIDEEKDV